MLAPALLLLLTLLFAGFLLFKSPTARFVGTVGVLLCLCLATLLFLVGIYDVEPTTPAVHFATSVIPARQV